jgi:predicted alpha/beta hydrolase family esterase
LPASFAYVLNVTNQEKLVYIGHSLGCATLFIALNECPQLNKQVEVAIALHPVSCTANMAKMEVIGPIFNAIRVLDLTMSTFVCYLTYKN